MIFSFIKSGVVPPPVLLSVPARVPIAEACASMSLAGRVSASRGPSNRAWPKRGHAPPPTVLELRRAQAKLCGAVAQVAASPDELVEAARKALVRRAMRVL